MPTNSPSSKSQQPSWIMRHLFDPLTLFLVGTLGMDDHNGTRILAVKGRKSGLWRTTPVRLLELEGGRYMVAMYGKTSWVKNLRSQGQGRLQLGREVTEFKVAELSNEEKLPALRAYFRRYWSLVGPMIGITSPDAPDEELAKVAPRYPVFRLE